MRLLHATSSLARRRGRVLCQRRNCRHRRTSSGTPRRGAGRRPTSRGMGDRSGCGAASRGGGCQSCLASGGPGTGGAALVGGARGGGGGGRRVNVRRRRRGGGGGGGRRVSVRRRRRGGGGRAEGGRRPRAGRRRGYQARAECMRLRSREFTLQAVRVQAHRGTSEHAVLHVASSQQQRRARPSTVKQLGLAWCRRGCSARARAAISQQQRRGGRARARVVLQGTPLM
jgi:hypothetical protein